MMKLNVYRFNPILLLSLFLTVEVIGQSYTRENSIERSFSIASDTEIEISNKYGDITLESWEKDSVKVIIEYKVTSTKESKLNKTYDAISFDFKGNEYYVVVATEFEGSGSFWSDVSDIASNLFAGGTYTSIDYKVYAPSDQKMAINLKYGNIYMTDHNGPIKISLSNGDLKAHNLNGKSDLEIQFGNATLNSILAGDIKLNYGTFNLDNAENLSIVGRSSEFELGYVNELIIDTKRDQINIEEVNNISGKTYFSRLTIDEVHNNFDLSMKYGSIKLKEIGNKAKKIGLTSINTSVNIYLHQNNNYAITIISDEKADVTYSAKIGDFDIEEIKAKEKLLKAMCIYGNHELAIPVVIDIKSGFLSLKLQD
jgi:hypothetical protein